MTVLLRNSQRTIKTDTRKIRRITGDLLAFSGLHDDRDLSLLFVHNRAIRKLNRDLFGRDWPTNVISFSYMDGLSNEAIGDIVISVERAREEAEASGVPLYERIFALIIHGLLHVLGYDHEGDRKEARRMQYRERKLLEFVMAHELYKELVAG